MTEEQLIRFEALPPKRKKDILAGKRLTKVQLGLSFPSTTVYNIYYEQLKRDELVRAFNNYFGTGIK